MKINFMKGNIAFVGISAESEINCMEKAIEFWKKAKEFDEEYPEVRRLAMRKIKEYINKKNNKGGKE